jgi:hypothetical protein
VDKKTAVASVLLIAVGFGVWVFWPDHYMLKRGLVPDPEVSPHSDELPDYLYGKWKGQARGPFLPYTIELSISPNEYLEKISTFSDYCVGRLEVLSQEENSIKFTEHITEGNCIEGKVTLSKAGDFSLITYLGIMSGLLSAGHYIRSNNETGHDIEKRAHFELGRYLTQ